MMPLLCSLVGLFCAVTPLSGATIAFPVVGGTGTSTAPTADQILIGGDTAGRYDVKTLTAGSNITIATSSGLVTISAAGSAGGSGLGTTSPWTIGQVAYVDSNASVTSVATGTVSGSTGLSVTANRYVLGGNLVITNDGVTSISASAPLVNNLSTGAISLTCPTCSTGGTTWGLYSPAVLTPTTSPMAILVNAASSTITNLVTVNSTSTNATTTALSIFGTASTSKLRIDTLANGALSINTGAVYSGATTTYSTGLTYSSGNTICDTASASVFGCLTGAFFSKFNSATTTFSTGLTYTAGTNAVTVNTSQNIATLSNLTSNGYVKTSGSNGTLGVQAVPIPIADGGSNATSYTTGSILYFNGTSIVSTSTNPLYVSAIIATSTTVTSNFFSNTGISTSTPWAQFSINPVAGQASNKFVIGSSTATSLIVNNTGYLGLGTTTPWARLSINPIAGDSMAFTIGSSTKQLFAVNTTGGITVAATQPATTTTIILDWSKSGPQVEYQIGGSATSITIINATTSDQWASTKRIWVFNPGGTAGALTWNGVEWIGTAPTQTTTANQGDLYSCNITRATSTSAYKVACAASTGFQ